MDHQLVSGGPTKRALTRLAQEASVPDLELLLATSLLSEAELKALVAKRRDLESKLSRFRTLREDFLRAVEYEVQLDRLLTARIRKNHVASSKASRVAAAFEKRVDGIFDRALRSFPAVRRRVFFFTSVRARLTLKRVKDLELWSSAVAFAHARSNHARASQLLGAALKLHPRSEALWTAAASHALDKEGNVSEARALFLQALRANPDSVALHYECFKLELIHLHKVAARRLVLGVAADDDGAAVPLAVYRDASRRPGATARSLCGFLDVVKPFRDTSDVLATLATAVAEAIVADVELRFGGTSAEAWELIARSGVAGEADDVIARGIESAPAIKTALWSTRVRLAAESGDVQRAEDVGWACAAAVDVMDEPAALAWLAAIKARARETGKRSGAYEAALERVALMHPTSSKLWAVRAAHSANAARDAVRVVALDDASLEIFVAFARTGELADRRAMLQRLFKSASAPAALFEKVLEAHLLNADTEAEVAAVEATGAPPVMPARVLNAVARAAPRSDQFFERALTRHTHNAELWTAYVGKLRERGDAAKARAVLLRALANAPEVEERL